ncbi:ABC transporter permease [Thermohalobacter berrensis]|uniref:Sulfonate ABC transporter permease n=1 Tax=Thermohalobacter berrensis TaxID=99594 RepID=A0A419T1F7_9FIRM|nr:ABC transporter permease [Thermohalobacter berrensis]RKD31251.1 sulfonate ABC transporter permease [Thermohalobacter berrensis]
MSMSNNNKVSYEHQQYIQRLQRRKRNIKITQVAVFVVALALWEIAARLNWVDTFLTSYPSEIWNLFVNYISNGSLFHHVGISLMENIFGFTLGTLLGILIAILLWWSEFISKVLDPYLVVLNSLPKTALAPIIILWVGAGYTGIIATAIAVSIVVTIMNVYNSFKEVDEDKIKMLKTFGANKVQILKKVILPASVPSMISSLKINIGLSWVGVIVGEFLVSKAGIGYLIMYGGQVFRLDLVMMSVFILAILAAVMYQGVAIIENKFMKWRQ